MASPHPHPRAFMKVKKTKLTPSPHPSKAGPIVGDEIKRTSLNLGIAKKWRMGGVAWVVVVVVVVVGLWGRVRYGLVL